LLFLFFFFLIFFFFFFFFFFFSFFFFFFFVNPYNITHTTEAECFLSCLAGASLWATARWCWVSNSRWFQFSDVLAHFFFFCKSFRAYSSHYKSRAQSRETVPGPRHSCSFSFSFLPQVRPCERRRDGVGSVAIGDSSFRFSVYIYICIYIYIYIYIICIHICIFLFPFLPQVHPCVRWRDGVESVAVDDSSFRIFLLLFFYFFL